MKRGEGQSLGVVGNLMLFELFPTAWILRETLTVYRKTPLNHKACEQF